MKSWIVSNLGVCLLIMRFINMKGLNWSQELTHEMVKEVFTSKLWKIHLLININHTHRSILKRVNHIENLPHEVQCKLMKLRERWKMERSRWEFGMCIISISQSMALKFDRFKRRYYIFVFNPMWAMIASVKFGFIPIHEMIVCLRGGAWARTKNKLKPHIKTTRMVLTRTILLYICIYRIFIIPKITWMKFIKIVMKSAIQSRILFMIDWRTKAYSWQAFNNDKVRSIHHNR